MTLSLAQLADKYRNQRDMLSAYLHRIIEEDAAGKGYFAKLAEKAFIEMEKTSHLGFPEDFSSPSSSGNLGQPDKPVVTPTNPDRD
jgi:hypothetical protein